MTIRARRLGKIQCDLGGGESVEPGELPQMFPVEAVAACAEALSANADLSLYGSAQHADDLEAVRVALGYGKLNLRGGSYGTRAMMVYAQRYPDNVRTMFGIGVDSPIRSNMSERGVFAQRTLIGLGEMCRQSLLVENLQMCHQRDDTKTAQYAVRDEGRVVMSGKQKPHDHEGDEQDQRAFHFAQTLPAIVSAMLPHYF